MHVFRLLFLTNPSTHLTTGSHPAQPGSNPAHTHGTHPSRIRVPPFRSIWPRGTIHTFRLFSSLPKAPTPPHPTQGIRDWSRHYPLNKPLAAAASQLMHAHARTLHLCVLGWQLSARRDTLFDGIPRGGGWRLGPPPGWGSGIGAGAVR
jgi:hypothetical protein